MVARSHDGDDAIGVRVMLTRVTAVVAVELLLDAVVALVGELVVVEPAE